MIDRTHRELTDEDIARITDTYHLWRGEKTGPVGWADPGLDPGEAQLPHRTRDVGLRKEPLSPTYEDIPGFCKSASLDEVRKHGHVLTPGRYVGAEAVEDDGEPFDEKMQRLVAQLREQQVESEKLDAAITANLKELGYGA